MAAAQSGHDIVLTTAVELVGVALMGILAGINDDLGKVLVIVMWGFVLGWFILNSAQLKSMVSKI